MPERCVMTTQSLPAASLRTANCLPAARVLLRVATYLIYKALWSIKRAILGVESFFLPASPVRQGNPEARLPAAVVALSGPEQRAVLSTGSPSGSGETAAAPTR